MCARRCFSRYAADEHDLLHTLHSNGCSPVCFRRCCFSWAEVVNARWQLVHEKGFTPLCIRMWAVRSWRANLRKRNFNGLNSLDLIDYMCNSNLVIIENQFSPNLTYLLLHISQVYGFSPVCVRLCVFNVLELTNDRSHRLHLYGFSPRIQNYQFLNLNKANWIFSSSPE